MISKILFTAAIIALVYWLAKNRTQRTRDVQAREAPRAPARQLPAASRAPRLLAYGLLIIMLSGSLGFIYLQWRDRYQIISIRVINTNTGGSVNYQARRGDVEQRSFETLDGRRVVLAAVERMELGAGGAESAERRP